MLVREGFIPHMHVRKKRKKKKKKKKGKKQMQQQKSFMSFGSEILICCRT